MIDPFQIHSGVLADRTEPRLLVQADGFGLDTADKKEHDQLNYT